jgi:hypothetical protein
MKIIMAEIFKLLPDSPVYELSNGTIWQMNRFGTTYRIDLIQPDPHLPGCMDITDAITSCPTIEELREIYQLRGKNEITS